MIGSGSDTGRDVGVEREMISTSEDESDSDNNETNVISRRMTLALLTMATS